MHNRPVSTLGAGRLGMRKRTCVLERQVHASDGERQLQPEHRESQTVPRFQ